MKKTLSALLVLGVLIVSSLAISSISACDLGDIIYLKVGESTTLNDSYLKSAPERSLIINYEFDNAFSDRGVVTAEKNGNTLTITGVKAGNGGLTVTDHLGYDAGILPVIIS